MTPRPANMTRKYDTSLPASTAKSISKHMIGYSEININYIGPTYSKTKYEHNFILLRLQSYKNSVMMK